MNLFFLHAWRAETNLTKTFAGQSETRLTALGIQQTKGQVLVRARSLILNTIISSPPNPRLDLPRTHRGRHNWLRNYGYWIDKATMERSQGVSEKV